MLHKIKEHIKNNPSLGPKTKSSICNLRTNICSYCNVQNSSKC